MTAVGDNHTTTSINTPIGSGNGNGNGNGATHTPVVAFHNNNHSNTPTGATAAVAGNNASNNIMSYSTRIKHAFTAADTLCANYITLRAPFELNLSYTLRSQIINQLSQLHATVEQLTSRPDGAMTSAAATAAANVATATATVATTTVGGSETVYEPSSLIIGSQHHPQRQPMMVVTPPVIPLPVNNTNTTPNINNASATSTPLARSPVFGQPANNNSNGNGAAVNNNNNGNSTNTTGRLSVNGNNTYHQSNDSIGSNGNGNGNGNGNNHESSSLPLTSLPLTHQQSATTSTATGVPMTLSSRASVISPSIGGTTTATPAVAVTITPIMTIGGHNVSHDGQAEEILLSLQSLFLPASQGIIRSMNMLMSSFEKGPFLVSKFFCAPKQ
jgi:hypothetical protein